MIANLKPWQISFSVHAGLVLVFIGITQIRITSDMIEVPIVYETPPQNIQNLAKVEEKPAVVLKSVNKMEQDLASKNARQVFGTSRDSYTDEADKEGIDAKKGNTLAKAADTEVLKDTDAGSLPTPTEEYLVSEMPAKLSEVRPVYPKEARDKKLEGTVVLDILIDASGTVRDAKFLEGQDVFRAPALEAIKKFLFRPAKMDGNAVAVRIRYTMLFELEF